MTATFNWTISTLDRELSDGAVFTAHWRCNAEQTEGTGEDATTYTAYVYGTCGFTADPTSPDFIPYDQLTEADVLGWVWNDGVDKDATEAALQANIDGQINPTTAEGVPW